MKYKISKAAYNDLSDIWIYTFQKWSENQANKYFEGLIEEIDLLSHNPENAKKMPKVRSDFFYIQTLSHYIFFKRNDNGIVIVRILQNMMDFSKHLE